MNKITLLILCLLPFCITAQSSDQELRTLLNQCLGKIKTIESPPKGKAYYMSYATRTAFNDPSIKPVTSEVELIVTHEQSHYRSKEFDYFHDQKDAFTIMPMTRMIFWSDSPALLLKKRDLSPLASFRDQALSRAKLTQLKNNTGNTNSILVKIEHDQELQQQVDYQYVVLELDTQRKQVTRTLFKYKEKHDVDKLEIKYNTIDMNYKVSTPKQVRNLVVSNDSKLLSKYNHFKLIDNRSSK